MRGMNTKLVVAVAVALGASASVYAGSGSWKYDADGNWNSASNWTSLVRPPDTVPNGVGQVATFTVATSPRTVTLNANESVGKLEFNTSSGTGDWKLFQGGTSTAQYQLTLDNGTSLAPEIAVGAGNVTTNVRLKGTSGFTKIGAGTLIMQQPVMPNSSTFSTLTGTVKVSDGTVRLVDRNFNTHSATSKIGFEVGLEQPSNWNQGANPASLAGSGSIGVSEVGTTRVYNGTLEVGQFGEVTPLNRSANVAGSLTVNGSLTLDRGSEYHVALGDTNSAGSSSLLTADTINVKGTVNVNVYGLPSFDPYTSSLWQIMAVTGTNQTIDPELFHFNIADGTAEGLGHFDIGNTEFTKASNTLWIRYSAVPEATTLLMGLAAGAPLLMHRGRRVRKTA